uniref:Uncharacterized protein n=1 Tax=Rhizophora mucronata TaxID=61149 RepID=A0A2P2IYX1_RHIMU
MLKMNYFPTVMIKLLEEKEHFSFLLIKMDWQA